MDTRRKFLNKQQTTLRQLMTDSNRRDEALALFLHQHALLHSAAMAQTESWSYEDAILNDASAAQIRRVPHHCEHSIAWCLWHIARIEDVTMSMLVDGSPQILDRDDWPGRLQTPITHCGNDMRPAEMTEFSAAIDLAALRAYRLAVGRRTRATVGSLSPQALKQKVDPARIEQVRAAGVIVETAGGIIDYWSKRTIAGLLLMPATRHSLVHLNEAFRLKQRRR